MSTVINTYLSEVNHITTENEDRISTEIIEEIEVASSFPYDVSNYGTHTISFTAENSSGSSIDFNIVKNFTQEILHTEPVPANSAVFVSQSFHFNELDEIDVIIPPGGSISSESIVYLSQDNLYIFPGLELGEIVTSKVFELSEEDNTPVFSVVPLNSSIQVQNIDENFIFTERVFENHQVTRINPQPLRLIQSNTNDNSISSRLLAPNLSYYDLPQNTYLEQSDLRFFEALNILDNSYLPSNKAVFSGEFYSTFYIKNESLNSFNNIKFSINGGNTIKVQNNVSTQTFYESDFYELNNVDNLEDYKNSAPKNSSLFNQVKIEVAFLPKNVVFSSNNNNIESLNYFNSTNVTKLPSLAPNDFVGIALKITTQFNINQGITEDYSFMHLSFINNQDNFYDEYGSQSYSSNTGQVLSRALPSIAIKFVTDYERLVELIQETTEELYSNYPPFFSEYPDNE